MTIETKVKFDFKTPSLKDAAGTVIGKGTKRPSVELLIPVPSWEEVCAFEGKERELVMESVLDTVYGQTRNQINELIKAADESGTEITIDQSVLKMPELTWSYIANMPPAKRGAAKIEDEAWEAFKEDYVAVMQQASQFNEIQLRSQANVFADRFNSKGIKGNRKIIAAMAQLLSSWFAASPNAEEHVRVYKFLSDKADSLLNENAEKKMEELFGNMFAAAPAAAPVEDAPL